VGLTLTRVSRDRQQAGCEEEGRAEAAASEAAWAVCDTADDALDDEYRPLRRRAPYEAMCDPCVT
jgi:hypothetical protein